MVLIAVKSALVAALFRVVCMLVTVVCRLVTEVCKPVSEVCKPVTLVFRLLRDVCSVEFRAFTLFNRSTSDTASITWKLADTAVPGPILGSLA